MTSANDSGAKQAQATTEREQQLADATHFVRHRLKWLAPQIGPAVVFHVLGLGKLRHVMDDLPSARWELGPALVDPYGVDLGALCVRYSVDGCELSDGAPGNPRVRASLLRNGGIELIPLFVIQDAGTPAVRVDGTELVNKFRRFITSSVGAYGRRQAAFPASVHVSFIKLAGVPLEMPWAG